MCSSNDWLRQRLLFVKAIAKLMVLQSEGRKQGKSKRGDVCHVIYGIAQLHVHLRRIASDGKVKYCIVSGRDSQNAGRVRNEHCLKGCLHVFRDAQLLANLTPRFNVVSNRVLLSFLSLSSYLSLLHPSRS